MLFPEKKAPTRWPQRPQIFPNDDDERLASAILTFARDYEYKRHGTLSLLAGIDLLTGKVHALVRDRHRENADLVSKLSIAA
jgi:hypothetical protein